MNSPPNKMKLPIIQYWYAQVMHLCSVVVGMLRYSKGTEEASYIIRCSCIKIL